MNRTNAISVTFFLKFSSYLWGNDMSRVDMKVSVPSSVMVIYSMIYRMETDDRSPASSCHVLNFHFHPI